MSTETIEAVEGKTSQQAMYCGKAVTSCPRKVLSAAAHIQAAACCEKEAEAAVRRRDFASGIVLYEAAAYDCSKSKSWLRSGAMLVFAAECSEIVEQVQQAAERYIQAVEFFEKAGGIRNVARCYELAAIASEKAGNHAEAGRLFAEAANACAGIQNMNSLHVVDKFWQATRVYANAGLESDVKKQYASFKVWLSKCPFREVDEKYFNVLGSILADRGLEEVAREVYVDKMERRRVNLGPSWRKCGLWVLKWSANYGESSGRWLVSTAVIISFFALLYLPSPIGCLEWTYVDVKQPPDRKSVV